MSTILTNKIETKSGGLTLDPGAGGSVTVEGNLTGTLSATSVLADGVIATTQATSDNSTKVATTAYVKSVVTAEDLDIAGDSGTGAIDLDSQTLTIEGTANEIETSASGQTITIGLPSTITANVSGNVTGNLTGTILTAAQANITSVGTLSSLAVSGATTLSSVTTVNIGAQGGNTFVVDKLTGGNIAFNAGGVYSGQIDCGANGNLNLSSRNSYKAVSITDNGISFPNGYGIDFSATAGGGATSSLLDDYEEGTFTATVIGSSTAGTATYVSQAGMYTKIGRMVSFSLYVDWSSGTGTGNLRIAGLPFTANAANVYPAAAIGGLGTIALTADHIPTARVQPSTSTIFIIQVPAGGGSSAFVPYDSAGYVVLGGTYFV